jgi:membrane protein
MLGPAIRPALCRNRLFEMPITAAAQGSNPSQTSTSPIWTVLLGVALIRLVTAKRREPFGEVVFGRNSRMALGGGSRPGAEEGQAPEAGKANPSHTGGNAARKAVTERDRGRAAESPTEIPAKGWKDILWRTYEEMTKDRILAVAAGVAFFGLLALFPAVTSLVSLYGLFADITTINDHLGAMAGFMPGGAIEIVGDQVKRIAGAGESTLGSAFFFGLAISLWSANAGMKAIFDALNVAYGEEEKRGFIALNLRSLTFTFGAIVFILIALGGVVAMPIALKFAGLESAAKWILSILRWPALLLVLMLGLAALYRFGPSRDNAQWRWITPGSALASVIWLVVSMLFSWYVANFGNYNETYGSLGAVIGFMTWLWISTTIILVGAELNAEIEHQTAKDTTAGPEQPLGTRGARMADAVGAAKA